MTNIDHHAIPHDRHAIPPLQLLQAALLTADHPQTSEAMVGAVRQWLRTRLPGSPVVINPESPAAEIKLGAVSCRRARWSRRCARILPRVVKALVASWHEPLPINHDRSIVSPRSMTERTGFSGPLHGRDDARPVRRAYANDRLALIGGCVGKALGRFPSYLPARRALGEIQNARIMPQPRRPDHDRIWMPRTSAM